MKFILRVKTEICKLFNTIIYIFTLKKKILINNSWVQHCGQNIIKGNLGDDLNFYLLSTILPQKYFSSYSLFFFNKATPNFLCIGSIVDTLMDRNSIVWGSGAIEGKKILNFKPLKVYAVRGPLTRNYLLKNNIECPRIYGDPAILLPFIFKRNECSKKYKIGVIPHYVDNSQKNIIDFIDENKDSVIKIEMTGYNSLEDVITIINQCEIIISSSLHGLIISDAYDIPNLWCVFSNGIKGDKFKFHDYLLGVGRGQTEPINLKDIKLNLDKIIELCNVNYNKPTLNAKALLDCCPFKHNLKIPE